MSWLLETPWPSIWVGAIIIGLLAVALVNTGKRALFAAMFGVAGVVLLLVLVEWLVETDTEQIENTMERVAVALETNDVQNVLALMAPDATEIRSLAESQLPRVDISDANIGGDLQVTVNHLTIPPTARAQFTARINGTSRTPSDGFGHDTFVRRVSLKLRKTEGRWLLTEFEQNPAGQRDE